MEIKFELDDSLYTSFQAALLFSGKTQQEVFTQAAEELVRQVFFGAPVKEAKPTEDTDAAAAAKALTRWAEDAAAPEHGMLQAYFRCSFGSEVYKPTLRAVYCGETGKTPGEFEALLTAMSTAPTKIFACTRDTVAVAPAAAEQAYALRSRFLGK